MTVSILIGDCRARLAEMPSASVNTCVTSPPYFGLRDYGHAGQIGLEDTPAAFVAQMVEVFREVRRVLRDDGTCWVNLGDSYNAGTSKPSGASATADVGGWTTRSGDAAGARRTKSDSLKVKDLMGIPWRVAFALQEDGWYLRQDIIWSKPNPMPESVTDRCTKAHEYMFLLSKGPRYYFDAAAISEPMAASSVTRLAQDVEAQAGSERVPGKTNGAMKAVGKAGKNAFRGQGSNRDGAGAAANREGRALNEIGNGETRNKRSVWTVATQPFKEAHFATYPPELIEPCILAGCPAQCCSACGAPYLPRYERGSAQPNVDPSDLDRFGDGSTGVHRKVGGQYQKWLDANPKQFRGADPSCACDAPPIGGTVLDPFAGAGTTGLVADRLGRNATLIELNPEYADIARRRIQGDQGMFGSVEVAA